MAHSSTYYRQARKIAADQALSARLKDAAKQEEAIRDGYTEADRAEADKLEARGAWREFLATEL